jgi:hypothetical protein
VYYHPIDRTATPLSQLGAKARNFCSCHLSMAAHVPRQFQISVLCFQLSASL